MNLKQLKQISPELGAHVEKVMVRVSPTREERLEQAVKLVIALNRMPIKACVPKINSDNIPVGYSEDYFIVDLDPKALEQLQNALLT